MSKKRSPKQAEACVICSKAIDRGYPTCADCELLRNFHDRPCRCESCANPDYFPAAMRARFPGQRLVLIAKSSDPPGLVRASLGFDAIKPEYHQRIAKAMCALMRMS